MDVSNARLADVPVVLVHGDGQTVTRTEVDGRKAIAAGLPPELKVVAILEPHPLTITGEQLLEMAVRSLDGAA